MAIMNITDIMEALPHRYPMLLVDRIVETDYKTRMVALKNLTYNESFFRGHFPDNPVMPGVLQIEAMAQVAGILLNHITERKGAIAYFLAIDNARFRRVLIPGDQMRMEINILKIRMGMCRVHATISVDGEVATEADLLFGRKD
jgi:3-hydroxyacyl-[acyl-carrier-protein] dehydratase